MSLSEPFGFSAPDGPVFVAVTKGDATGTLERVDRRRVGKVAAFAVGDRHLDDFALAVVSGKPRLVVLDPEVLEAANKALSRFRAVRRAATPLRRGIGSRCRCSAQPAPLRMLADGVHDAGPGGDGAAPEIVAVGEAAREHHEVGPGGSVLSSARRQDAAAGDQPRGAAGRLLLRRLSQVRRHRGQDPHHGRRPRAFSAGRADAGHLQRLPNPLRSGVAARRTAQKCATALYLPLPTLQGREQRDAVFPKTTARAKSSRWRSPTAKATTLPTRRRSTRSSVPVASPFVTATKTAPSGG